MSHLIFLIPVGKHILTYTNDLKNTLHAHNILQGIPGICGDDGGHVGRGTSPLFWKTEVRTEALIKHAYIHTYIHTHTCMVHTHRSGYISKYSAVSRYKNTACKAHNSNKFLFQYATTY